MHVTRIQVQSPIQMPAWPAGQRLLRFQGESAPAPEEQTSGGKAPSPLTKSPPPKKRLFKRLRRVFSALTLFVGLTPGTRLEPQPDEPSQSSPDPEKPVFVMHAGMGDKKNLYARIMKFNVMHAEQNRVHEGNIIILDNIYPTLHELAEIKVSTVPAVVAKGWKSGITDILSGRLPQPPILYKFIKSLKLFFSSDNTESSAVITQHAQLQAALRERGLEKSDIILVGHSAGGQMMLSLSQRNARHTEIPMNIKAVVLLGSPLIRNNAPPKIQVISVISSADALLNTIESAQNTLGLHLTMKHPDNTDENDVKIDDTVSGHTDYTQDPALAKCILAILNRNEVPAYPNGTVHMNGVTIEVKDGITRVSTPEGTVYQEGMRIAGEGPTSVYDFLKQFYNRQDLNRKNHGHLPLLNKNTLADNHGKQPVQPPANKPFETLTTLLRRPEDGPLFHHETQPQQTIQV